MGLSRDNQPFPRAILRAVQPLRNGMEHFHPAAPAFSNIIQCATAGKINDTRPKSVVSPELMPDPMVSLP